MGWGREEWKDGLRVAGLPGFRVDGRCWIEKTYQNLQEGEFLSSW